MEFFLFTDQSGSSELSGASVSLFVLDALQASFVRVLCNAALDLDAPCHPSERNASLGCTASARRVGTMQASRQTPNITVE